MAQNIVDTYSEVENVLQVDDVVEILHTNKNKVYYLLNSGQLPGFRLANGRNWLIPQHALNEYIRGLGVYKK